MSIRSTVWSDLQAFLPTMGLWMSPVSTMMPMAMTSLASIFLLLLLLVMMMMMTQLEYLERKLFHSVPRHHQNGGKLLTPTSSGS